MRTRNVMSAFLGGILVFFSTTVGAEYPMWTLDFENYNVGDLAEAVGATDRFQRDNSSEIDSSQTIVANPDPDSNNMSSRVVRTFFAQGSSGPTLIPPKHSSASNGDTIWTQFRVYIPAGFSYWNLGQGNQHCIDDGPHQGEIKFFRMVKKQNAGWISLMLKRGNVVTSNEVVGSGAAGAAGSLPFEKWTTVEIAVKISSSGNGYIRVWINGANTYDWSGSTTDGSSMQDHSLLWSNWNCRVAQDQYAYIDDMVIATSNSGSPPNRDSQGRLFIGPAINAPLPPNSIQQVQ